MTVFGWTLYGLLFMFTLGLLFPLEAANTLTMSLVMILFVFLGGLDILGHFVIDKI